MDPCEYCNGYQAVMWDLEAGTICLPCHEKRRAIERQKALDDEREAEAKDRERWQFWHE